MAFSKKKTFSKDARADYDRAYDKLNSDTTVKAADKIDFEMLEVGLNPVKLADLILDGTPLVLNFEQLDIDEANKVLAFLSGVIYVEKGEVVKLKDKIYLFARREELVDGSIKKFINELD